MPPILLHIGQSSLYCLTNSQTPIFKTSPNPQFIIAKQFNLTMPSGSIDPRKIMLTLDKTELATALGIPAENLAPGLAKIHSSVRLRRRGIEAKLVIGDLQPEPDPVLMRTLWNAHRWAHALQNGTPLTTIASDASCTDAFIRTRGQLAFLSPKIQIAIIEGTLSPEITLKRMMNQPVPLDWTTQERMFGL